MDFASRMLSYVLIGHRSGHQLDALEELVRPDGHTFRVERYKFFDPERTRCDVTVLVLDPKGGYAWVLVGHAETMAGACRLALEHPMK